jgi:hypothetical protein
MLSARGLQSVEDVEVVPSLLANTKLLVLILPCAKRLCGKKLDIIHKGAG